MIDIVGMVIGWGVPAKIAKPLVIAVGIIALAGSAIAAWNLWLSSYVQDEIDKNNAQAEAAAQEQARQADEQQGTEARGDDGRNIDEQHELEGVVRNDPNADNPATDADRAYLRCIQLQQHARATGEPAPTCS